MEAPSSPTIIVVILTASAINLLASSLVCCSDGYYDYSVAAGVISLCFCIGMLLVIHLAPHHVPRLLKPFSLFIGIFWSVTAGIQTFKRPFVGTSNGWFSSWIAFFASILLVYTNVFNGQKAKPQESSETL